MAQHQEHGARGWIQRVLAVCAVVLVSACQGASGSTELSNGLHVPRSEGGTPGVGDAALLEGKVIDKDGCLAIQDDEPHSDDVTVPVFDVKDKRADKARIGKHLSLGGGAKPPLGSFDIPEACAGEENYFLVVRE